MKNNLTPEQSQCLIKLSVDPSKASTSIEVPCGNMICHEKIFDLTDILSLLPKEIEIGGIMILRIKWAYSAWFASYINEDGSTTNGFYGTELIDALFELLVWCITNKHLKV